MAQLRQDYAKFTDRDTEVIAIGPETIATLIATQRVRRIGPDVL